MYYNTTPSQNALIRVCCLIVAEELCNYCQLGVLLCVRESERVSEETEIGRVSE